MKALSCIQPWASALLTVKDIENRSQQPPKSLLGQRIAIHASAAYDKNDAYGLLGTLREELGEAAWAIRQLPQSALLGTVRIAGWVKIGFVASESDDPLDFDWSAGLSDAQVENALRSKWRAPRAMYSANQYIIVLDEPKRLEYPISCKGALGYWYVPEKSKPILVSL